VRAHGATRSADATYAARLHTFYLLQCRQAAAYALYAATTTFLPSAVVAAVLFYGGTLVLSGQVRGCVRACVVVRVRLTCSVSCDPAATAVSCGPVAPVAS
jgi:hypothetical protein